MFGSVGVHLAARQDQSEGLNISGPGRGQVESFRISRHATEIFVVWLGRIFSGTVNIPQSSLSSHDMDVIPTNRILPNFLSNLIW